ncbi:MAG: hypothetical protein L0387_26600 [Acidobacteria bacterium]|nr:hypothetical protein [Acidobacteriota bacterium]
MSYTVRYLSYGEAQPILEAVAEAGSSARSRLPEDPKRQWDTWVRKQDAEIRARLEQGDEDSLMNWLLFGVTFTRQPRVTARFFEEKASRGDGTERQREVGDILVARSRDLIRALAKPGSDERRWFARNLLKRKGYDVSNPQDEKRLLAYFRHNLERVFYEQAHYGKLLEDARRLENRTEEFAARSKLYGERGLSLDTTVLPNFALAESLRELKERGVLLTGSVRRVGVIGPGLDFADKDAGYDLFPPQTIQPFALVDALLRLGLADWKALEVVSLDISPRVNDHVRRMRARARQGSGYTLQLLRDPREGWGAEAIRYWETLGEEIGAAVKPATLEAGAGRLRARAVRVRPDVVQRVKAADVNIVLQRLETGEGDGFDLLIATNIFIYYDTLEQSLALANAAAMLRPGGLLLSNNALLELPVTPMRSVGYRTTVYSERPDHGDHIVWYQKTN